jgi:hypothetical protein
VAGDLDIGAYSIQLDGGVLIAFDRAWLPEDWLTFIDAFVSVPGDSSALGPLASPRRQGATGFFASTNFS